MKTLNLHIPFRMHEEIITDYTKGGVEHRQRCRCGQAWTGLANIMGSEKGITGGGWRDYPEGYSSSEESRSKL